MTATRTVKVQKIYLFYNFARALIFVCTFVFAVTARLRLPWLPEVFLACGGNFRCWPKAFRAGHCKDLTETGNRARKVSGTQGRLQRESA